VLCHSQLSAYWSSHRIALACLLALHSSITGYPRPRSLWRCVSSLLLFYCHHNLRLLITNFRNFWRTYIAGNLRQEDVISLPNAVCVYIYTTAIPGTLDPNLIIVCCIGVYISAYNNNTACSSFFTERVVNICNSLPLDTVFSSLPGFIRLINMMDFLERLMPCSYCL